MHGRDPLADVKKRVGLFLVQDLLKLFVELDSFLGIEFPPVLLQDLVDARVHVVDLDAAFSGGKKHNRTVIGKIAKASRLEIEVGGGVRSAQDCEALFALGARYAVLGTVAIKDPALTTALCQRFPGHIVVAVDARDGLVAVEGWTEATKVTAIDVGKKVAMAGAAAVLYTDIGRDGMRTGPNTEATRALARAIAPCPVIASGGVAALADLDDVVNTGAESVIIGKAIYEGVFTVNQAVERAQALAAAPRG